MATHKTPDNNSLRVPHCVQPGTENTCIIHALWMVVQYMENNHPKDEVLECSEGLSMEEIESYITVREMGWTSKQAELDDLNEDIGCINFKLRKWEKYSPTTTTLFNKIEEHLDRDVPLIVVVDAESLKTGRTNTRGPMHAVVVTGMEDGEVYINDPYNGTHAPYSKQRLADSWDTQLNRLIEIEVEKPKRQQNIGEVTNEN